MEKSMTVLSQKIDSYTVFEDNQVLTSGQLNRLTDYLDRQHRLSRVKLLGIGIVCGLDVMIDGGSIIITKGCAVTSDGDLIDYDQDQKFKSFRKFEDENAGYSVFRPGNVPLGMYELLTVEDAPAISGFQTETGRALEEMSVVLYLESYLFDPDLCTGGDCDNKGKEQRNVLKALLIAQEDTVHVLKHEPPLASRFPMLDDFAMERVTLVPDNINNYNDLAQQYRNVITNTIKNLKGVLKNTFRKELRPLLGEVYQNIDPTTVWNQTLDQLRQQVQNTGTGVQYAYDFLKDIVAAYNEFKEALFADNVICCPDVGIFPKHVVLGRVIGNLDQAAAETPRHGFYESPVLNLKTENLEKARYLHKRIDRLINAFEIPTTGQLIKITPSQLADVRLGSNAIPYYYKIDPVQPLNVHWSYELSIRNKQDTISSFNADKYSARPRVLDPLSYSISNHGFFRIEGHLGMNVEDAEEKINAQISQYNLPIKVMTLQIDIDVPPIKIRPWFWSKDLKVLHYLHRKDIGRTLSNLKSFTVKLKDTIQGADELPGKDVEADKISFKGYIEDNTKELDTAVNTVGNNLKVMYKDFNYNSFLTNYNNALQKAADVNKSVKGITYASAFTPYETIVNDTKFEWLEWIDGVLKKRKERAEELSIFSKFLAECPGMEHLAGVERGGTFVLVYSAGSKNVVADFSLPYWYCDLPADEEAEEETVEVDVKEDWIQLNDFMIRLSKEKILENNFSLLQETLKGLELKMTAQEDTMKVFSGSLNTYTDTILKTSPLFGAGKITEGFFIDPVMGYQAMILENAGNYIQEVDAKINAGTATPAEEALKAGMEDMSSKIIKETMTGFKDKKTDILPGSQEEKFMEAAVANAAKMTTGAVKQDLSSEMAKIQQQAGDKAVFANNLNKLIMK
jgi:hypothetical protein